MIDFARFSTESIKIGFSIDVESRIRQLEEDFDEPIEVIAVMEGDKETEKQLHRMSSHLRFGLTEQFRPGSALLEYIGCGVKTGSALTMDLTGVNRCRIGDLSVGTHVRQRIPDVFEGLMTAVNQGHRIAGITLRGVAAGTQLFTDRRK